MAFWKKEKPQFPIRVMMAVRGAEGQLLCNIVLEYASNLTRKEWIEDAKGERIIHYSYKGALQVTTSIMNSNWQLLAKVKMNGVDPKYEYLKGSTI